MAGRTELTVAAQVDLSSVYKVVAKGRVYYYAWKGKGAPRLRAEPGSDAFVEELAQALSERNRGDPTRIATAVADWKRSDAWMKPRGQGGLADSTKKNWRPFVDAIQSHFGPLRIAQFDRAQVIRPEIRRWRKQWKDHPRQADMAKQVLSSFCTWLVDEDRLTANPCLGLPNFYSNDRSDRIWRQEDLARLDAHAPPHVVRAARLAALTGLRQTDLLRLAWSHVGELAIELPTGKSGQRKTTLIPMYGELRDHLASLPRKSTIVLVNSDDQPWKSGFTSSWNKALKAAGFLDTAAGHDEDLHFHDLRGTAATRMFLGGLDIREIAEVMTWSEGEVETLINRYVKRDELLRDRIRRLDENTRRTSPEKPAEKL